MHNELNDEVDNAIDDIKEQCESNLSPQKMFGMVSVKEMKKEKVDALAFSQMMMQCHNQMTSKMDIKKCGNHAIEGMKKELWQLHMRDSFIPRHEKSLTAEEQKKTCEAVNLTKEKSSGETKGGTCANGGNQ